MILFEQQQPFLNNKQWALHTAGISEESDLFVDDVTHNADFLGDVKPSTKTLYAEEKSVRVFGSADPIAIHKHFNIATGFNY